MRRLITVALLITATACGNGNSGGGGGTGGTGGGGSGGGGTGGTGGGGGAGGTGGGGPQDFPSTSTIYQDISGAAVDSESTAILSALPASWGGTGKLGIDASFTVYTADASLTPRAFMEAAGATPDCDTAPIPVPPGGHIEGETDYHCASGGDCHLLVYQNQRLYELYQADISTGIATTGTFTGSCLVVWDLTHDYWANPATIGPGFSRGDGCNGADAADLPMAPLILKPAEISAGAVNHAMRFTLPNSEIRKAVYVHPVTHIGGPTGGATTLPYGARLRLKASFDVSTLPSDAARVVAAALKKYGMFLADGGNPYISATDDIATAISPSALTTLKPTDFEMVDGGTRINYAQQNCTRTPISQ